MAIEEIKLLEKLGYDKQLTFAYLTCERLYPNYIFFSQRFEFGNELILRSAIDFIYSSLLIAPPQNQNDIKSFLKEIELNTPDTEDFSTVFVSSALDSCTAILETLDFMIDKNVSRLTDISTFATDTVYGYVGERNKLDYNTDPLFEDKILNDPLMQRELGIQKGIISYLSKTGTIEAVDIKNLQDLQYNIGRSNIDLA